MKTRLPIILLLTGTLTLLSLTITACTSTPTDAGKPLPELTFEQMNRIPVTISRIDFTNTTRQRHIPSWNREPTPLPTPPDIAVRRYLSKRFMADGTDGVLTMTLIKADVKESEIPNEMKILSYIPLANQINYRFEVEIDLERLYLSGQPNVKTNLHFTRDTRMAANASLAHKEAELQRTLEELVHDIDEALITAIGYQFNLIAPHNIPRRVAPVNTTVSTKSEPLEAGTKIKAQQPLSTIPHDRNVIVEGLD